MPAGARNHVIDLLRGLSIVLVMMNHINLQLMFAGVPYADDWPPGLTSALVWNGQAAVQVFFVISGYLITSNSIRRWGTPAALDAGAFYRLRFARIAPLMLLLLTVLSALHLLGVPGFVVKATSGGLPRALLAALTFHVGWLEATRGYLPGSWDILWSLSVEELFYLFFPLVARGLRRQAYLVPLLLAFVVAGPFARMKAFNPNPVWREYSYLGGMDAIALGCLTAMLLARGPLPQGARRVAGIGGGVLLLFTLGFPLVAYRVGLGRTGLLFSVVGLGVCLVVAASVGSGWRAPGWMLPGLGFGRRSYEIYLTHMFVVLAVFAVFRHAGKPLGAVPLVFIAVIGCAALLGWGVGRGFTDRMNRRLRGVA